MRKPASARSAQLTGTWSILPPCSAFFDDVPDNPLLDYTFSLGFSHTTNEQAGSNPGFPSTPILVQDSVYGYIDVVGTAPAQARLGNSFQDVATGSAAAVSAKAGLQATGPVFRNAIDARVTPTATVPMSLQVPQAITIPIAPDEQITGQEPVAVAADPIRPRPRPKPAAQETLPKPQPAESTADSGAEGPPSAPPGAAETKQRGTAEGMETSVSADSGGAKGASPLAGNAAVSNDAGTIMRQINRTLKPCVGVRDIGIVGFEIRPDGRLASATILQSSGDPAIIKQHLTTCDGQPHFPPAVRRRASVSG